ncbi:hypothetical protein LI328DRAFT_163199 [Trichoderma asperelloides]|nr:hypothetical protein LI328DRAFT_163199 [Trichoderma asperelloides]
MPPLKANLLSFRSPWEEEFAHGVEMRELIWIQDGPHTGCFSLSFFLTFATLHNSARPTRALSTGLEWDSSRRSIVPTWTAMDPESLVFFSSRLRICP